MILEMEAVYAQINMIDNPVSLWLNKSGKD